MTVSSPAIELNNVSVSRGDRIVLRDVTFSIPPGTLTAVIGPNGAGKSSMFGVLSGRLELHGGERFVDGVVAEVLQQTVLETDLPLTVEDVVRMGRYQQRGMLGRLRAEDRALVKNSLKALEIDDLARRPINELSGGQRQRVLVAQGLVQDAPVLLLDEPTTGLDVTSQARISRVMKSTTEAGKTVLFSTHNLREAREADYVIVLASECVCCAAPVDAFADPAVTALFGPAVLEEHDLLRSHDEATVFP